LDPGAGKVMPKRAEGRNLLCFVMTNDCEDLIRAV